MELISLASGASYFNTPAVGSQAAVAAIEQHKTFYGQPQGTLSFRTALVQRYEKQNQAQVSPEHILITPGTKFALYNVLRQILKPGDEVIVPVPNWPGFHEVLQLLEAKLILLPTYPSENYALDPKRLQALITPKTRVFLYSNPSNPTGRIFKKDELAGILTLLNQHSEIYVLADEIYDLVTFGERVPSLAEFVDLNGRHIIVNGFSKNFAMSGWRIGYLVVPPALLPACIRFQDITFSGVSDFVQEAAEAVITQLKPVLEPILQVFTHNRKLILNFLATENIPCFAPEGAYYVFPDFSGYFTSTVPNSLALTEYLLQEYKLEMRPGDYFGAPGFVRISFAIKTTDLEIALKRLKSAFNKLRK